MASGPIKINAKMPAPGSGRPMAGCAIPLVQSATAGRTAPVNNRPAAGNVAFAKVAGVIGGDVTAQVRSAIEKMMKAHPSMVFPSWDKFSVQVGEPAADLAGKKCVDCFDPRLSVVYDFMPSLGGPDHPSSITRARIYCDDKYLADGELEDMAMKTIFKLIQMKLIERLLSANRQAHCFTTQEILDIARNDRYTDFIASVEAVRNASIYGLDKRGATVAALTAILVAYNRMTRPDDGKMASLRQTLRNYPEVEREYADNRSLFCQMFIEKLKVKAAQECQDAFRVAGKYAFDNRATLVDVPYENWDEDLKGCSEIIVRETLHYANCIRQSKASDGSWFLISQPVGFSGLEVPVAAAAKVPAIDFGEKAIAEIRQEVSNCDAFMPGIRKLKILNREPDEAERKLTIRDPFNEDDQIIELEYRTGENGKRYPLSVRSISLFCPSVKGKLMLGYGEMLTRGIAKAIQISIIDRILELNEEGDYISSEEVDAVLLSDGYINLLSYMQMLANRERFDLDPAVSGVIAMSVATLCINGYSQKSDKYGRYAEMRDIVSPKAYFGEEIAAYTDALVRQFLVPPARLPQNMIQGNKIGTAILQGLGNPGWMTSEWGKIGGSMRDNILLITQAVEKGISLIKNGSLTPQDWLITAGSNGCVAPPLPEQLAARLAKTKRETLSADAILGSLQLGIRQRKNYFVARQSYRALEDLKILGGSSKRWFIPEIVELRREILTEGLPDDDRSLAGQLRAGLKAKEAEEAEKNAGIRVSAKKLLLEESAQNHPVSIFINNGMDFEAKALESLSSDDQGMASEAAYHLLVRDKINGGRMVQEAIGQRIVKGNSCAGIINGVLEYFEMVAKGYPDKVREKAGEALLSSGIKFRPALDQLILRTLQFDGQVRESQLETLKTLSALLGLHERMGILEGMEDKVQTAHENITRMAADMSAAFIAMSDFEKRHERMMLASAIAHIGLCNSVFEDDLFAELFENLNMSDLWFDTEKVSHCADGIRAQLDTEGSGFRARLLDYVNKNASDAELAEKVLFGLYLLAQNSPALEAFDLGAASEQELGQLISSAGVADSQRLAKLIKKAGPKTVAEFEARKINGLGQSKEKILEALKKADIGSSVRGLLIRCLSSENPLIVSMAVQAASWLKKAS